MCLKKFSLVVAFFCAPSCVGRGEIVISDAVRQQIKKEVSGYLSRLYDEVCLPFFDRECYFPSDCDRLSAFLTDVLPIYLVSCFDGSKVTSTRASFEKLSLRERMPGKFVQDGLIFGFHLWCPPCEMKRCYMLQIFDKLAKERYFSLLAFPSRKGLPEKNTRFFDICGYGFDGEALFDRTFCDRIAELLLPEVLPYFRQGQENYTYQMFKFFGKKVPLSDAGLWYGKAVFDAFVHFNLAQNVAKRGKNVDEARRHFRLFQYKVKSADRLYAFAKHGTKFTMHKKGGFALSEELDFIENLHSKLEAIKEDLCSIPSDTDSESSCLNMRRQGSNTSDRKESGAVPTGTPKEGWIFSSETCNRLRKEVETYLMENFYGSDRRWLISILFKDDVKVLFDFFAHRLVTCFYVPERFVEMSEEEQCIFIEHRKEQARFAEFLEYAMRRFLSFNSEAASEKFLKIIDKTPVMFRMPKKAWSLNCIQIEANKFMEYDFMGECLTEASESGFAKMYQLDFQKLFKPSFFKALSDLLFPELKDGLKYETIKKLSESPL